MGNPTGSTRRADRAADFKRFGVGRKTIKAKEDGQRIDSLPGHFEWWYADVVLRQEKIGLAVVFFTKPFTQPGQPLEPVIKVGIVGPGLDPRPLEHSFAAADFKAESNTCDVVIGNNRFRGDLNHYEIDVDIPGFRLHLTLDSLVRGGLRLGTGHQLFERGGASRFFGWLPAVPAARAKLVLDLGDRHVEGDGFGYHDHNWGDADMSTLMHHWYWGRATTDDGRFTVIAAQIVPQTDFGSTPIPIFILLENFRPVSVGDAVLNFELGPQQPDPNTGKLVPDWARFSADVGPARYVVTFNRQATILDEPFDPALPRDPRLGGAYHRFQGAFTLQKIEGGVVTYAGGAPAMWELMFFGDQGMRGAFDQVVKSLAMARAI